MITERFIKYTTEIGEILKSCKINSHDETNETNDDSTEMPGMIEKDINSYIIYGDVTRVQASIRCFKQFKFGYFLIDTEDISILKKYRFAISVRKKYIIVISMENNSALRSLLVKIHPFKNRRSKHYVSINDNPLDFRMSNLQESIHRNLNSNNLSGHRGVYLYKNRWYASVTDKYGTNHRKSFSAGKYNDNDLQMAVKMRIEMEKKYE